MDKNARISVVAGLGKTGLSIAHYLQSRSIPFVMFDTREQPTGLDAFRTEFEHVDVYLWDFPECLLEQVDAVYSSPGVSLDTPFMQAAKQHGIPILGDIECLAREIKAPVIGITGTNGKSTVTMLVGEMAKAAGIDVGVAGNIGTPVLTLLDQKPDIALWVLELSSFQLDLTYSLAPLASTILNISDDHLDRHHDLQSYINAKQRIYHQAKTIVFNRDDRQTSPDARYCAEKPLLVSYGLDVPPEGHWGIIDKAGETYLAFGDTPLLATSELKIKGRHNWANALAACALATTAGINMEAMVSVLTCFSGLPHRAQWVRTLSGIEWIDDSKGTNVGATVSAILGIGGSMQGKIVLIAGGQGKGADFTELREPMVDHVRMVVLIGEDADVIQQALDDVVPIERADSLEAAVLLAKQQAKPGDVVLLSPACASFDMFRDYNHRGEVFTTAVQAL